MLDDEDVDTGDVGVDVVVEAVVGTKVIVEALV